MWKSTRFIVRSNTWQKWRQSICKNLRVIFQKKTANIVFWNLLVTPAQQVVAFGRVCLERDSSSLQRASPEVIKGIDISELLSYLFGFMCKIVVTCGVYVSQIYDRVGLYVDCVWGGGGYRWRICSSQFKRRQFEHNYNPTPTCTCSPQS